MSLQPINRSIDGWMVRQHIPAGPGLHPIYLMLHGWTGDESSMWVFASRLPEEACLLAPRGLYPAPSGGYSWHSSSSKAWPWVDDFQPAIDALLGILSPEQFPEADFSRLRLVGFSQGAALAYALALQQPSRITALAGLSGFLPDGAVALARNRPLLDKKVFVAHGSLDDLVPVERARQSVELLQEAGAQVTYCEDQVGHKLSTDCFQGMQRFFASQPC